MNWKNLRERAGKKPWVFLYMLIYFPWFFILEHVVQDRYYLIECRLDHILPFCEYFIVPYLFWFVYVAGSFLWFMLKEDDSMFYRFSAVMFGGMTIALIIYTLFPNGIHLRPDLDASRNLFTWLTSLIYKADTCTNVFPSLHVYTSAVIAIFFSKSRLVREKPGMKYVLYAASGLIILSTVFLKQHSVLDMIAGNVMAWALCKMAFVEEDEEEAVRKNRRGLVPR
ncbi:MAG: phosphatase PAP2 family protein [Lachnospiraceae bacterium]|nr:phosphatase PAP2 family protein [Lachnospiraceae bacterium]MDY4970211.1 phosphatase PAP2 family protein [Lachnospiraceae bacterium]